MGILVRHSADWVHVDSVDTTDGPKMALWANGRVVTKSEFYEMVKAVKDFYEWASNDGIEQYNKYLEEKQEREWRERQEWREEKERNKPPPNGYVYVIKGLDTYKIGITGLSKPETRLKQFDSLPFSVERVFLVYVSDYKNVESLLHERYESQRINGEWFTLEQEDLDYIETFLEERKADG